MRFYRSPGSLLSAFKNLPASTSEDVDLVSFPPMTSTLRPISEEKAPKALIDCALVSLNHARGSKTSHAQMNFLVRSRVQSRVGRTQARQLRSLCVLGLGQDEDVFLTSHRGLYSQAFKAPCCRSFLRVPTQSVPKPKHSGGSPTVASSSTSERPHQPSCA